jgi:Xaa-Pro aminopeptidase
MNTDFEHHLPKIDPTRRIRVLDPDSAELGPTPKAIDELASFGLALPDVDNIQEYRLERIKAQLNAADLGGILLYDPINIRYATGSSNMQVWTLHNFARAAFVSASGHVILWDFAHCKHLTRHLPLINEIRTGAGFFYFELGAKEQDAAEKFAKEIRSVMLEHGCGNRISVDKIEIFGLQALQDIGVDPVPGQRIMEQARVIKSIEEIQAMRCAVNACEIAVGRMHEALKPGLAEVELWSILHAENIARGGEWVETRLLTSGPRTNPWMMEAGPRILQDGDLVAFDSDLIGLYGICVDMSRTWYCGDGTPSAEQIELHRVAVDHINGNMEILKPGLSFTDISYGGHQLPEKYRSQQYCVKMHGVGMCDEYPSIYYPESFIEGAFEDELRPGMTLCVEAYVGAVGGRDGVKLENQVLITNTGFENLTTYPYDEKLLGS